MGDVFISYKREDRPFAERLSIVLEQLGFEVWWDFDLLSGDRYRRVIRAVIDQAKVAVVVWSVRAIDSDFVLDEAEYAKTQGKLCPVRMDAIEPPFGFGALHTDDLADWDGELFHPQFQNLVRAIEVRIGRKGKLGGAPHPQEAQASAAELEAFKAAQLAGNPSALRAFLNRHPRGAFSTFVRGQLADVEAKADAPAPAAAVAEAPVAPSRKRAGPRPPRTRVTPPAAPPPTSISGPPPGAEAPFARKPGRWPLYVAGMLILLAAVAYLLFANRSRLNDALTQRAEASINGSWMSPGLSCAGAEKITIKDGRLTVVRPNGGGVDINESGPITETDTYGVDVNANGRLERVRAKGDFLKIGDEDGSTLILTRCP